MRNSECCSCFMGFSAEAGKPQLSQLPCYKSATAAAAVAAATAILLLVLLLLLLLLLLSCYWYCYCCCHCDYCCYNDEEVAFPIYCFAMHSAFVEQFTQHGPEPKPIFVKVGLGLGARVSVVMLSFDFSDPLCRAARRANLRERGQGHLRQVQKRQRASACRAAPPCSPSAPSTSQHAQKTSLNSQAWILHSGSNEVCRARSR